MNCPECGGTDIEGGDSCVCPADRCKHFRLRSNCIWCAPVGPPNENFVFWRTGLRLGDEGFD